MPIRLYRNSCFKLLWTMPNYISLWIKFLWKWRRLECQVFAPVFSRCSPKHFETLGKIITYTRQKLVFAEFDMNVIVHNGHFYEAQLPVKHCPGVSGCRSVIQQTGVANNVFKLNESFVLTLKVGTISPLVRLTFDTGISRKCFIF